ncbi:hypothetical protein [Actinophytocola sp.]|uniref:hypothetical protein n=1 Tax=Actinophytocola sp. TaxID=1872138 RepID=UPI002ED32292
MSSEQQQPVTVPSTVDGGAEWGAARQPRQPKGKRSAKKAAIAVAVALGIAGAGAGVVYAASGSTSATEQGPGGTGGGMGGPGGSGGGPGGMGALSQALHGEYVVSDGNGGYTTEVLQNGEVTAISDTSITAKSEDGYSKTYTIDADALSSDLSDIATGDDVTIIATVDGDTATVDSVVEEGTATGQMGQAPPGQSTDGTSQDSSSSGN